MNPMHPHSVSKPNPSRGGALLTSLALALMVTLMAGCSLWSSQPDYDREAWSGAETGVPGSEYIIGPADVLSVSVLNQEDLERTVRVRPDGRFSFALVGEVQAAGLTPEQLQQNLHASLAKYINVLPGEVSVMVDSVHSYTVSVLGEVRAPGRFEFQEQVTVLDALAQAGGLTEFASRSDIVVLRTRQGKTQRMRFDYKEAVNWDSPVPRMLLMPGDVVVVP